MNASKIRDILQKEASREMTQSPPTTAAKNKRKFKRLKTRKTDHFKKEMKGPLHFLKRERNSFLSKKKVKKVSKERDGKVDQGNTVSPKSLPSKNNTEKPRTSTSDDSQLQSSAKSNSVNDHLKGSQFRYLNELLYTQSSQDASKMFKEDPSTFSVYHSGFEAQRKRWPKDPLKRVIKFLDQLPKHFVVADFGCGDARLAATLKKRVIHSFDFVALNERVTACDMRKTPLKKKSVDVAVFCLSLMGTNCSEFILEASRVLKNKGILKIVEISSRIERLTRFVNQVEKMGFLCIDKKPDDYFVYLTFMKQAPCPRETLPIIILKPCSYKKR